MVASAQYIENPSSHNNLFNSPPSVKPQTHPHLRYTEPDRLTATLRVRTLLATRRRLLRLENGILYVNLVADECGHAILSTRLTDAESITSNDVKATITIKTEQRITMTLAFKHDMSLFYLWLSALNRAKQMVMSRYYKIGEKVGSGHYANVFKTVERSSGRVYAVKVINKSEYNNKINGNEKSTSYLKRECEIVKFVKHNNIINTIDIFEQSSTIYIVMDYIENGNLLQHLTKRTGPKNCKLDEQNVLKIAVQLLKAIAYLHKNDIIHRDIKAENVLITSDGNIKLADFGLARQLDGVGSDEYCLSSILGTPAYCSPEVIMRLSYGKPVDVFGCGVLLYIALSGSLPFKGDSPAQVFQSIASGKLTFAKSRWGSVSAEARDFVARLMSHRACDRPSAEEALCHPWITSNGVTITNALQERYLQSFVRNSSSNRSIVDKTKSRNSKKGRNLSFYGMSNNNNNNNNNSNNFNNINKNNNNYNNSHNSNSRGENNNYNNSGNNNSRDGVKSMSYSLSGHCGNDYDGPNSVGLQQHFPSVNSACSFRRAQSGSLRQLTLEKMRQRAAQLV